ncbi:hypothetical protein R5R35_004123 [Gryllus longicercus]|uniref:Mitochondrial ribosomal protein S18C n=1 Tax=Gryllus longicercus TaxID=2509291 RepID=A0AAN9YYW0_9ORTH
MSALMPAISKTGNILKSFMNLRASLQVARVRPFTSSIKENSSRYDDLKKESDPDMPLEDIKNPFEKEKIKCILCEHNIRVDYKNVRLLSQFVSRYTGRIYGRHITRLCKAQQERVEKEIWKAQQAGLMGGYTRDLAYANDPQLFNPDQPIRPHRF